MTDRIMLDSVNAAAIIAAVKARKTFRGLPIAMAAGYTDGSFTWADAEWAALTAAGIPELGQVRITVLGSTAHAARAADEEPGNIDPAGAARWVLAEHTDGHWPVVYCDRVDKPRVIAECGKFGLLRARDFGLWVATLDGSFTDLDGSDLRAQRGVVAVQFLGAKAAGGDYDVSLVVSSAWRAVKLEPVTYRDWLTKGHASLHEVAEAAGMTAANILIDTVKHYGTLDPVIAGYVNGVFARDTAKIPAGGVLRVRRS